ncbi:hypothetical protein GCM10007390_37270 [Persicitalea jodogahamensis]|uniref:Uncharacterized protein n=2 Tax=Persicitalea jodogahamensis TaxID=402147 RepID=A0A8J3D5W8_9BACT|nr:hypothetical protein GCM10007390_37270 [Persicitalea jodogahamensis]
MTWACSQVPIEKPVLVSKSEIVSIPADTLSFNTSHSEWEAMLYTHIQPLKMRTHQANGRLMVFLLPGQGGILEGPARLELATGNRHFYYPVTVRNSVVKTGSMKDYRSPKTVNPDSALAQQRIVHIIDPARNLLELPGKGYFLEQELTLDPTVAVYRANADKPLTAYYVEPGSCVNVPVQAGYKKGNNSFEVVVGPLIDRHGNTVADGTLVTLTLRSGGKVWHLEENLQNGLVSRTLPAQKFIGFDVQANVQDRFSKTLKLSI